CRPGSIHPRAPAEPAFFINAVRAWSGTPARPAAAASTSEARIRPPGPVPATVARSTPRSTASLRTAGAAFGRPPPGEPGPAGGDAAGEPGPAGGDTAGEPGEVAGNVPAASRTTSSWPTFTMSPAAKRSDTTCPATGDGSSTSALSVWTSTSGWSRTTVSPGPTSQ